MKWATAAGLIALVVVVTAVFWRHTGQVNHGVHVISDAEPLRCEGTPVELAPVGTDDGYLTALATIDPQMQCKIRFFVENSSGHDLRIKTVSAPVLGPTGGPGVQATHLDPTRNNDTGPLDDEIDAIWIVDDELLDGERLDYEMWVEFRPGGCTSEGGTISFSGPTVVVTSWHMDITIEPTTASVGFIGSQHSSCDN